jgi:hypothetical protein
MRRQTLRIPSMFPRQNQSGWAAVFRVRQKKGIQPLEFLRLQFLDLILGISWISNHICLVIFPRRRWTISSLTLLRIRVSTSSRSHWPRILNSTSQHAIVPKVPKDPLITTKRHIVVVLPQLSIQQWREIQVDLKETGSLWSAVSLLRFCINRKLAGAIQILSDPQKRFSKTPIVWQESMQPL